MRSRSGRHPMQSGGLRSFLDITRNGLTIDRSS
jgi:hypothetical protein